MSYKVEENVLRFDISMNDLLVMNVVKSLADLSDDRAAVSLLHSVSLSQHL